MDATGGTGVVNNSNSAIPHFGQYAARLHDVLSQADWSNVDVLAQELLACWKERRAVHICGNGGSAGNAMHMANDFLYGISKAFGSGLRVQALPANSSVMTCLANDEGYDAVFSYQLAVQAQQGDVLIALSGSGNSPNILQALKSARELGVKTFAILGYSGGKALELADHPIHFPVNDMQISEDLQLIVAHMIMQWLYQNRPTELEKAKT
jgi:D-sedoheptulose 7-phosphate isomerase